MVHKFQIGAKEKSALNILPNFLELGDEDVRVTDVGLVVGKNVFGLPLHFLLVLRLLIRWATKWHDYQGINHPTHPTAFVGNNFEVEYR